MAERKKAADEVSDRDRAIDKPRKRSGRHLRDRGSPTPHPEQHEEFAGTERLPSASESGSEEQGG